jgi:hypothetical protein
MLSLSLYCHVFSVGMQLMSDFRLVNQTADWQWNSSVRNMGHNKTTQFSEDICFNHATYDIYVVAQDCAYGVNWSELTTGRRLTAVYALFQGSSLKQQIWVRVEGCHFSSTRQVILLCHSWSYSVTRDYTLPIHESTQPLVILFLPLVILLLPLVILLCYSWFYFTHSWIYSATRDSFFATRDSTFATCDSTLGV